jgi:hypothetical protein
MIPDLPSFVSIALKDGGVIKPLLIPSSETNGTGLMNPSIIVDDGKIRAVLRHVNYTFYHSEKKLFQHQFGPLTYVHPEHDMHLRTTNWYLELDDELEITRYNKIDTSFFDTYEPKWDFVGLEDARIFRWNGKLYTCGVRRDTTPNGQGRMELCEILVMPDKVVEVMRFRIPAPNNGDTYCEKNWMPISDKPYHLIKWSNPTELVSVNPIDKTCTTEYLSEPIWLPNDIRGGSQVIRWGDNYLACTHEVQLFNSEVGRKDAIYRHRFIVWDSNWNIVKYSRDFDFLAGHVEFCIGMDHYNDDEVLMTFGFQDNAAYVLKVRKDVIDNFINGLI